MSIAEWLSTYKVRSKQDAENAIQEMMQEVALLGLWRAKFFEHAAFYGGTALRILYGLNRFSEDLDFSLLKRDLHFDLSPFLKSVEEELHTSGFKVHVEQKPKRVESTVKSAFLKTGTLETFIHLELDQKLRTQTHVSEKIKIKFEIDIDPPQEFSTEMKHLLRPMPFSVRSYQPQDLFAGKMHALLFRPYKVRVKGRDWYDFIWYAARNTPVHLAHLEARMEQSGHLDGSLNKDMVIELLREKIGNLDVAAAIEDVRRFVPDESVLRGWSKELFLSISERLQFC